MVHHIAANFNQFFPFRSDEAENVGIAVGDEVGLNSPTGEQPVRVEQITNEGFVLTSLPGHDEGEGRTIVFSIEPRTDGVNGMKRWDLHVEAGGPASYLSAVPGNSRAAYLVWDFFRANLSGRLPESPETR